MNNVYINPINIALKSLNRNKSRTILTILGIIIGIASVITIFSAGESIKAYMKNEIEGFGTNIIQVEVKVPNTAHASSENAMGMAMGSTVTTLKDSDRKKIEKLSNIKKIYSATLGQAVATYKNSQKTVMLQGVTPAFIDIDKSKIEFGRFFTDYEDDSATSVVVLGSKLVETFFGDEEPLNKNIKIHKKKFKVIGVLKERGASMAYDLDSMILMPLQTIQKKITGTDYIAFILGSMKDVSQQEITKIEIEDILRDTHDIDNPDDDDFAVTTMEEMQEMIDTILGGISLLLIAIAFISLIVGGVGIMNIMYVSVFERTYEIGLRKAIGASSKDILLQFLYEAVIITVLGGIIGILLGILFSLFVSILATSYGLTWPFILHLNGILIAVGFALVIGILFGTYPAIKASKMDPIQALRSK